MAYFGASTRIPGDSLSLKTVLVCDNDGSGATPSMMTSRIPRQKMAELAAHLAAERDSAKVARLADELISALEESEAQKSRELQEFLSRLAIFN